MDGGFDELLEWDGPLTHDEIEKIQNRIIERVIEWCDETPFKGSSRDDENWKSGPHKPDLRSHRIFPRNGLRKANQTAKAIASSSAVRNKGQSLRLITLRLPGERPEFSQLDEHLSKLSKSVSDAADDIQRRTKAHPGGIATPLLTTIHIRVTKDLALRFDPHVHAIWNIDQLDIPAAKNRLQGWFGQVWIDDDLIRNLKKAAYYITQGIIDYRGIAGWPREAFVAVWKMKLRKLIRTAGYLASENRDDVISIAPEEVHDSLVTSLGASEGLRLGADVPEQPNNEDTACNAVNQSEADGQMSVANPLPFLPPYRPSTIIPKYTVHRASAKLDLSRYPTLGDIQAAAIAVVEAERRDFGRSAEIVFGQYALTETQVQTAVARAESYFHITMFHPGMRWMPTPDGVKWATTIMSAFDTLHEAADLGNTAVLESHHDIGRLPQHLRQSKLGT